ncbi:MAG: DNA gyrase inhibitor YacG [Sphingomonas sp.]
MSKTGKNSCPICGTPTDAAFAPFCSRGCKDRDLLQWLGEGYRLPGPLDEKSVQTGLDSDGAHD